MTQEEKAKAYDKAIERAKKEWSNNLDNAYKNYRERLEYIFPKLKESEDEKIRKHLIEDLKWRLNGALDQDANGCDRQKDIEAYKWGIAWLETQCEKKSADDIQKPTDIKIHQGDKNNPYDMSFEEAQNYITKRDFDICCTDCAVYADDRYIMQTIANVLRWADEHPKQITLSAADRGIIDEIIFALSSLSKEKMISYHKEIEFLNKIRKL